MCPASWGQTGVLSLAPPICCNCSAPQFLYLQNGNNNTCLFPMSQTEQMIEINVKCLEHQVREALENPEEAGSAQSISGHPTQNSQSPEELAKCTSLLVSPPSHPLASSVSSPRGDLPSMLAGSWSCVTRQSHTLAMGHSFHQQNWQFFTVTVPGSFLSPFLPFCEPELCCLQSKLLRDGGDRTSSPPKETERNPQPCHPAAAGSVRSM